MDNKRSEAEKFQSTNVGEISREFRSSLSSPIIQAKNLLRRNTEGLTCKLFSTTFTERALSWFSQLPEGLIQSFEQFGKIFLERYKNNYPQKKTMADLHLEQRYDESTRQFLSRFMKVT